jgi:hypothetical protein
MLHVSRPILILTDSMPKESADEQRARDLVKRIRKLRWIGEDELARKVAGELRAAPTLDCVTTISDTD